MKQYWIRTDEDHAYDSLAKALSGEHVNAPYDIVHVVEKSAYDGLVKALEQIKSDVHTMTLRRPIWKIADRALSEHGGKND